MADAGRCNVSPWYNFDLSKLGVALSIRVSAPIAAGLLFVAAEMVQVYGPLVDHHYAERLPFHGHFARQGHHSHTHLESHTHPMPASAEPDMTAAMPGEDGLTLPPAGVGDDCSLMARSALDPAVSHDQPLAHLGRPEQLDPSPPVRPPRKSV